MADTTKKEPRERKIVSASTGETKAKGSGHVDYKAPAVPVTTKAHGNAGGLRLGAVLLWVAAIAAEVVGILMLTKRIYVGDKMTMWLLIMIGVDLACVIIGAQLWKKANRIDPASEANKTKFWLWNNMGVIVCVFAFVPFILLLLTNKDLDGKTKKIASIAAIVALLIGGLASYDWHPVSQESLAAAEQQAAAVNNGEVYWTQFGTKYHLDPNCPSLLNSATIFSGSIDEAFEANRTELCKICEKNLGLEQEGNVSGAAASTPESTGSETASETKPAA